MSRTTVYMIRHAEAEGNLYRRIHGWYDSLLTEQGKKQVELLRDRLLRDGVRFDAVYSSDLKRTMLTAQAAADVSGLAVIPEKRLREVNLGEWEDLTWGDAEHLQPEQLSYFNRDPAKWDVPGSEVYADTQSRMVSVVRELAKRHEGGVIACGSHGAAIRVLCAYIMKVPSYMINTVHHSDNTGITELTVDNDTGEFKIVRLGDAGHLGGLTRFFRSKWMSSADGLDSHNLWFKFPEIDADHREMSDVMGTEAYSRAETALKEHPRAAAIAMCAGEPAGFITLDITAGDGKVGVISDYVMLPKYRGHCLSVQLMGHAVSVYRGLGRRALRISVPDEYSKSVGYFEHFGFKTVGKENGTTVLEKDISV